MQADAAWSKREARKARIGEKSTTSSDKNSMSGDTLSVSESIDRSSSDSRPQSDATVGVKSEKKGEPVRKTMAEKNKEQKLKKIGAQMEAEKVCMLQ